MPVTINGSSGLTANDGSVFTNASGNVGIGTSSPSAKLTSIANFGNGSAVNYNAVPLGTAQGQLSGYSFRATFQGVGDNGPRRSADIWSGYNGGVWGTEFLAFGVGNNGIANDAANQTSEKMRIASDGSQSSVIPGGSTLYPEFKCRAWVNFNGTTTPPTIRASGNVSSVTKNGTGIYTANFTTAMPDTNYIPLVGAEWTGGQNIGANNLATTSVQVHTRSGSVYTDHSRVDLSVTR